MRKDEALNAISNLINDTEYESLCKKYIENYASEEEYRRLLRILKEKDKFTSFRKIIDEYLHS